ncbi:poly-gamma-glutamate synthesis protein (capsule biosynthesis protein) [Krasilnikovia cinnamomea]|uniref:Poly-gamma-glutamate synthesis protein (Capsule biosynthesis protein) n=1 Tax=Krasilnikovia cinnamomea TaxID=349313 RepID=A0A4Q7ZVF4_9ACTN|nr:poly-gamma-glutamate synthesis protein (capsule biosynthesis protein) [Krasilnikovia cinnamomea]
MSLALCGDVMLGRGIDQILGHPGAPELWETYVRDARDYVRLAEAVNGPVPRGADPRWPWGDALPHLLDADVRVLNLETAVTAGGTPAAGKGIHYRLHPANLPCLRAARPDVCVLANNHVLDFGADGLVDTLAALRAGGLATAGAGADAAAAWRPAPVASGPGRVVVLAAGLPSSGIPAGWAATAEGPGVAYVPEPSAAWARRIAAEIEAARRPGDLVVASLHWGGNWGYQVAHDERRFAHALIDGGADVVHGHSSHHPRPVELHHGRLILYGCGDLINDYEGIGGHERYRADLRLVYLAELEATDGTLTGLRLVPLQARRLRLERATAGETAWLRDTLDEISEPYGIRMGTGTDGTLTALFDSDI